MLKLKIFLLSVLSFSVLINAQTFEGLIIYQSSHLLHISTTKVFIKDDKIRTQIYIDNQPVSNYSLNLSGKLYIISDIKESIIKNKQKKEVENIKRMPKKRESILGYACSLYKENRNTPYGKDIIINFISDSLKTDKKLYSSFVKNGHIVLKSIQKKDGYEYINEAVEILPKKLDNSFFELPDYPIKEVDMRTLAVPYISVQGNDNK